ncbi:MAG: hypothetical protein GKS06_12125 [Acidobacteria bacterium]|nr:hypothetical protein [Acidobacteriota bacterium]
MNQPTSISAGRRGRVVASVLLVVTVIAAFAGWVDAPATTSTDRVFQRALLTLAAARALDSAVSLAQGTEIALQPAGMGLTVSAGELLDPINDLLEQFSSLMLIATASLGLQGLLLRASAWNVLTWLLALTVLGRLAASWVPDRVPAVWRHRSRMLLVLLLLVRFALPAYALASGLIFEQFLEPERAEAVRVIEETTGDVEQIERLDEALPETQTPGWRERVSGWFAETFETLDVEARIEAFRDRLGQVVEQVIHLIVVFALQTVLLPLAFLWGMPRLAGLALDRLRAIDRA